MCLEACAVVGIEVWLTVLSRVFGVGVSLQWEMLGGCAWSAMRLYGGWFSCVNEPGL